MRWKYYDLRGQPAAPEATPALYPHFFQHWTRTRPTPATNLSRAPALTHTRIRADLCHTMLLDTKVVHYGRNTFSSQFSLTPIKHIQTRSFLARCYKSVEVVQLAASNCFYWWNWEFLSQSNHCLLIEELRELKIGRAHVWTPVTDQ